LCFRTDLAREPCQLRWFPPSWRALVVSDALMEENNVREQIRNTMEGKL
jgi:hypothetical protein